MEGCTLLYEFNEFKDGNWILLFEFLVEKFKLELEFFLWYFDEDAGLWKEEGSATLSGNVYTANVSHLSYWNEEHHIGGVRRLTICTAKF